MKTYFAFLTFLLAVPVIADDHAAIVEEAFSNTSTNYHQEWAFTQSTTEDGVQIVLRYDPRFSIGERWKLMSVDGREPSADEIEQYQDNKGDEFHENDDDNGDEIVKYETLSVVEETEDYWVFQFAPKVDNDEDEEDAEAAHKFMQQVVGTLKIIRDGHYIEYIDLRNERPIRPVFGVKIKRFLTHLTFGPAAADGPIVPLSIDVELKGRAVLFVSINESESIRYTDYEFVGT
jgi:hypothetical protein